MFLLDQFLIYHGLSLTRYCFVVDSSIQPGDGGIRLINGHGQMNKAIMLLLFDVHIHKASYRFVIVGISKL